MNEFVGYIDSEGRVFDGTFDYEGHVGPIGPQGEPGYTPQRGVDYWTDEDKAYVVAEATSLINGKIEEYNANATAKTNAFNSNASDKTTAFNNNASDKTTAFNSNATSKTSDYNDNATSKTTAFDAHVAQAFNELTGHFYLKTQTYNKDQIDAKIASTYHYKGSVTDYTQLPSSGQQVGDVWNIEQAGGGYNAGDNVAWTGTAWDILAGTVDLSNYYTKSQADTLLGGKQNTIDSSNKLASDLVDDTNQTNKFVTEADKTNWNGKEDAEDAEEKYAELKAENEQLLSQIPTATATGNPINVQDSSNLPIVDFALLGNATQADTPTPDTPQDIHVVTGDNTVEVLGKNLFSAEKAVSDSNQPSIYITDDNKEIHYKTGPYAFKYYLNAIENLSYTFTVILRNKNSSSNAVRFYAYYTDGSSNKIIDQTISDTNTHTLSGTTTANKTLLYIYSVNTSNIDTYIKIEGTQLEVGSTATTYEQFTSQTQLLSLGDTKLAPTDEIARVNGVWCINETPITDTTLISQLENVLKMHTNKNVTNISIVPTGTNAEPTAEVEYRVDLGTVIGNINNAIISLGGNV